MKLEEIAGNRLLTYYTAFLTISIASILSSYISYHKQKTEIQKTGADNTIILYDFVPDEDQKIALHTTISVFKQKSNRKELLYKIQPLMQIIEIH